jgi:outer membrane protein OmpA-like peptidoglycan-associated protein
MPNRPKTRAHALGALLLAASLGACAHDPNPNLARAEAEYRAAAADPLVTDYAPLLLEDARRALERAQRAQREGQGEDEVDHRAYVASRRAEIARVSAERGADVARAEQLSRQGDALAVAPGAPAVSVEDVHFEPERSRLPVEADPELDRVAAVIVAYPERWVRIEGHADETEREGRLLSEERAGEVAHALMERGVDPERISIRGFGATEPVASNVTATGRQRNRRVEIHLAPVLGAR